MIDMARLTEFDGKVISYFELAEKAIRDGKFEKAAVYVSLIRAAQAERQFAVEDGR